MCLTRQDGSYVNAPLMPCEMCAAADTCDGSDCVMVAASMIDEEPTRVPTIYEYCKSLGRQTEPCGACDRAHICVGLPIKEE